MYCLLYFQISLQFLHLNIYLFVAILLQPIMPGATDKLLTHMNVSADNRGFSHAKYGSRNGGEALGDIQVNTSNKCVVQQLYLFLFIVCSLPSSYNYNSVQLDA
jgi:hypothetical protein